MQSIIYSMSSHLTHYIFFFFFFFLSFNFRVQGCESDKAFNNLRQIELKSSINKYY